VFLSLMTSFDSVFQTKEFIAWNKVQILLQCRLTFEELWILTTSFKTHFVVFNDLGFCVKRKLKQFHQLELVMFLLEEVQSFLVKNSIDASSLFSKSSSV
jgi:hypothetical protein